MGIFNRKYANDYSSSESIEEKPSISIEYEEEQEIEIISTENITAPSKEKEIFRILQSHRSPEHCGKIMRCVQIDNGYQADFQCMSCGMVISLEYVDKEDLGDII